MARYSPWRSVGDCAAYEAVWTWLADAIEAVARQQGVDIKSPAWE